MTLHSSSRCPPLHSSSRPLLLFAQELTDVGAAFSSLTHDGKHTAAEAAIHQYMYTAISAPYQQRRLRKHIHTHTHRLMSGAPEDTYKYVHTHTHTQMATQQQRPAHLTRVRAVGCSCGVAQHAQAATLRLRRRMLEAILLASARASRSARYNLRLCVRVPASEFVLLYL